MFIGHYAVGFGAKRLAPTVSLGTLFLAALLADLIWPVLVLTGVERVEIAPGITAVTPLDFVYYPYTHSLVALVGWAALLGVGYVLIRRAGLGAGMVLAICVLSHWVLDVLTHRPDMPLTFGGGQRLGLGLWYSIPATFAVELVLFAVAVAVYARTTIASDRAGRYGFWALIGFLLAIYLSGPFGPPPPSPAAVAWLGNAQWLLVLWGYWLDRHRRPRLAVPVAA